MAEARSEDGVGMQADEMVQARSGVGVAHAGAPRMLKYKGESVNEIHGSSNQMHVLRHYNTCMICVFICVF